MNNSALYREVVKEVNGKREYAANFNVTEGDDIVITARAVGNVNFITVNATSPLRGASAIKQFRCKTMLVCNEYSDGVRGGRDQQCAISNVNLSHNGTTIKFFIDRTELVEINITGECREYGVYYYIRRSHIYSC